MSLSQLPNELLLRIFQYIPRLPDSECTTAIHSLANISICSRQLHIAVEPILYSSFRESTSTSLMSFLRTILQNPRLACYVKTYEAHDTRTISLKATLEYPIASNPKFQENSNRELKELLQKSIERDVTLEMTLGDLWKEDSTTADWDAATTLTFMILPNVELFKVIYSQSRLRQIEIEQPAILLRDAFRLPWLNKALLQHAQPLPSSPFPNINDFQKPIMDAIMNLASCISYTDQDRNPPPTTITLTLHNHTPTTLKVEDLSSRIWDFDILDNPLLSQLTSFEFLNSIHPMVPYKALYSRFSCLEKLHINFPDGSPFHFISLLPALQHLRPSLKDLAVRGWCTSMVSLAIVSESLVTLTALETLDVTLQHLLLFVPIDDPLLHYGDEDWNDDSYSIDSDPVRAPLEAVLPKGLRRLTLRRCDTHVIGLVGGLVREKLCGLRELEVLHLEFRLTDSLGGLEEEVEMLRRDCEEAGIGLTTEYIYVPIAV